MEPKIYVVRATVRQEQVVARLLYQEVGNMIKRGEQERVYSILYSPNLKGYVLVEADSPGVVQDIAKNTPKTKGLLLKEKGNINSAGTIDIKDLEMILMPTPVVDEVNKGDLVELVSGPFKKEKARVAKIDKDKNEITVELIEAAVPIPVIVKGDDLKIIKRSEEERGEDEANN